MRVVFSTERFSGPRSLVLQEIPATFILQITLSLMESSGIRDGASLKTQKRPGGQFDLPAAVY
jgi:hypothetical protein